MELREGMYVRTKDGLIDKVIIDYKGCCNSTTCNCKHVSCEHNYYDDEDIVKSSDTPIDLIEEGDYVNGVEVEEINDKEIMLVDTHLWIDKEVTNRLIESIVTKEMFNSVKYEVE